MASILVDMVKTRHTNQPQTPCVAYHLVNPKPISWSSVVPVIQKRYNVEPVQLSAWLDELHNIEHPTKADVYEKPALKLLAFYDGLLYGGEVPEPNNGSNGVQTGESDFEGLATYRCSFVGKLADTVELLRTRCGSLEPIPT